MHWLLSTPETFSLRELIRRCGDAIRPLSVPWLRVSSSSASRDWGLVLCWA